MKKNAVTTFLLACIPGCGLMYLGYMKKGLQIMLMTAASGILVYFSTSYLRFDWLGAAFGLLIPIIWFYQMFDSMHSLSRMRKLEIDSPEDDGFFWPEKIAVPSGKLNRTIAKWVAAAFLFIGFSGIIFKLLDHLHYFIEELTAYEIRYIVNTSLTPAVISLVLIVAGFRLLRGKKIKETPDAEDGGKE